MVAHQTKSFKGNHRSLFLISLGVIGMGMFLAFYVSGMFSFAAPESDSSISSSDKVTVDGVVNVAQYLTSLVLESPKSKDTLVLSYDSGHNALRIDGNINADALTVGAENQSSQGSTVIGGTRNEVFSSQNGLIVGGDDNKIKNSASNAVVVGSKGTNILSDNSDILSVGTEGAQFREGNQVLAAIGGQVASDNAKNSVALGQGTKKISGPTSVLLGGNIDSNNAHHLFVWSDSENAFQPQNSNGFYVKSQNGFGLNTTKPTTQLDIGNAGALRVPLAYVRSCNTTFKGVVSYAPLKQHNQYKSFCGCNGEKWVPLAGDLSPETVAACAQRNRMKCTGTVENANKGKNFALPLWNPDANGGKGDWEALGWKYSSNPSLSACQFNCKVGYHPNANNPEGWLPSGACLPCSDIANKSKWKSAGTGLNNCDFSCKGGFYYTNTSKLRACSSCKIGTYTTNDNQDVKCKPCKNKPKNAEYSGYGTGKDCPWECNAGYVKYGNRCYKKTKEMSCRTLPQDIINNPGNYRKGPEKYSQIFNAATGKYEPETKSRAYRQGNVRTAAHQGDFTVTNKNICVAPILQPCEWDCNCGYSYDENTHTCIKPECATVFKPGIYHYPLLDKFYDYGYPVFPDKTGWGRADKVDTASIPLNEKYPLTKWQRKDGMFKWTSTDIWDSALCKVGTVKDKVSLRGRRRKDHGSTLSYICEYKGQEQECALSLEDPNAHFVSWGDGPNSRKDPIYDYDYTSGKYKYVCDDGYTLNIISGYGKGSFVCLKNHADFYPVCNDGYSHSNKAGKCVIAKFECNTTLSEKMKKGFVKPTNNDFCSGNGKLNLKSLEGREFVSSFEFLQYTEGAKKLATPSASLQHMMEAGKKGVTATSSLRNSESAGSQIADLEANLKQAEMHKVGLPKKLVYHCQYNKSSYDDLYKECEIECEKGVIGDDKGGYACRQEIKHFDHDDKRSNYGTKPCPDRSGKDCYYNKDTGEWVDSHGNPTTGQPAVVGESHVEFFMKHDYNDPKDGGGNRGGRGLNKGG